MKQHTVLLVDDHGLVRAGLKSIINQIGNFNVVAEASGTADALTRLEKCQPDILLTDITMGRENGLDLARETRQRFPEVRIIMLSMHASEDLVNEALKLGASGYLLKEAAPGELEIALQAVMHNDIYLSPALSTRIIQKHVQAPAAPDGISILTGRQLQILTMIARRKGTKEIAFELDLSEKTVAAHRAQIMERLGVRDVVGLVLFAVKHGLVGEQG